MPKTMFHNGAIALAYAKAGFIIFPVSAAREPHKPTDRLPFGKARKNPLVKWSTEATRDQTKVQAWWRDHPEALIGMPCKANGIFLLDTDRHTEAEDGVAAFAAMCEGQEEPMPAHPVTLTDYEGQHHIFRMPDAPISNRVIGAGIETRGYQHDNDGGYFIAPGSRMPDGRGWRRMDDTPSLLRNALALPPQWLIDLCRPRPVRPREPSNVTLLRPNKAGEEAYALKTLDRVAGELARKLPDSGRDNMLMSVAATMGRHIAAGWIGEATVEGRLLDACGANGLLTETKPKLIRDKIRRGIKAGMNIPHEPLLERPRMNGRAGAMVPPAHQSSYSWDDPDISLLDDRRGDLPAFPLHLFSEDMQELIERTSNGAGVTHAHVAVPLIGIGSGLIGVARRVKVSKSWLQPTTCWTSLVGFSGTGKTPGLNVVRRALKKLERDSREQEKERERKHETKKAAAKAARKLWDAQVEEAAEAGIPAPEMPGAAVDPGKFIPVKLVVTDATIERLADLLQARPHGLVLVRDELSALFTNMSRYSGGQDDEFWLEAWNGDYYSVERMGRMLMIDHLLIGLVGGMQPDKLARSFEGDHDGKYARVLFAWPEEPKWSGINHDTDEIDDGVLNIVKRVCGLAEFADDRLVDRPIPLDGDALAQFEQFAQRASEEKSAFEGREREWFAKVTAHVLRLAGTFTFLEWSLAGTIEKPVAITGATMKTAIALVQDYFWPHARACLRQIGLTERHANARRALIWIRAKGMKEVSREDIRRDALSQKLDAAQTDELLGSLCNTGWLREKTTQSGPQGGKPARRWEVNEKLYGHPTALTALTAATPNETWPK